MNYLPALFILIVFSCNQKPQQVTAPVPVIDGDFWRIGEAPDLDSLNGPDPNKQHVVDHGFIKDNNDKWHLWACIRGTKISRLLYGWEGESLTDGKLWDQVGVVARALPEWNEQVRDGREQIQAPYFRKVGDVYFCFYNSAGIRVMISENGAKYERVRIKDNSNLLYEKGGRDVMVIDEGDTYYSYSTISSVSKDGWTRGFVSLRTSKDLVEWSDYTIVSEGGRAGNGPVSAESPFVQKYNGYYFLFRSSSSTNSCFVYRSKDPYNFGVNNDDKLVAELPVWAPEIIHEGDEWFISDIADFQGIKLARLKWEDEPV